MLFAHLSRRPTMWAYSKTVVRRRPTLVVVHTFKHLLPWRRWVDWSQISCDASVSWEQTFVRMVVVTWPEWPPRPYMRKPLQNLLKPEGRWPWNLVYSIGVPGPNINKLWFWVDLDLLNAKAKFAPLCICTCMGKWLNRRFIDTLEVYKLKLIHIVY